MPATTGPRRALAAAVVACVVPLGACTGDSDDPSPPSGGPESVALQLSMGPGADDLAVDTRDQLQNAVGATLSTYVVDGFLGDYPRDDFVNALDHFTSGVADRAATDIERITGAGFEGASEVVAARLRARISTFAPDREAVGVSAQVDFAFDVTVDEDTREVTLQGRLMLMPVDGEWKIFGYHVRTDDPGAGSRS